MLCKYNFNVPKLSKNNILHFNQYKTFKANKSANVNQNVNREI